MCGAWDAGSGGNFNSAYQAFSDVSLSVVTASKTLLIVHSRT